VNLRVDLILPSEQRSASSLNLRSLIRIGSILVPCALLAWLAYGLAVLALVKNQFNILEEQWLFVEPQKAEAIRLTQLLNANRKLNDELMGWKSAHINWHESLAVLPRRVPPTMQIQSVSVGQVLQAEAGILARVFALRIQGRATGARADQDVDELRDGLRREHALAEVVQSVEVGQFAADTSRSAKPEDRVFRLDCIYKPRPFK
jgi:hypothetical protein